MAVTSEQRRSSDQKRERPVQEGRSRRRMDAFDHFCDDLYRVAEVRVARRPAGDDNAFELDLDYVLRR